MIKKEEDEPISLGGPQKRKKKFNSFYDPPLPKSDEKFDAEEKKLNELVRRWKVHMFQMEIVNMQDTAFDPFLQIIIGGNYLIEIKKTSGGQVIYIPQGERGITYQTDVLSLVEPTENAGRLFTTEIITEMRASYFEIMQQRIHIELWDRVGSSGLFLNRFVGYASIPLIEIANGSFKQAVQIFPVGENIAIKQVAALSFNLFFEEIWDFHLTFMDWKTTSLEKEKQSKETSVTYNPQVQLKLQSPNALEDTTESSVIKNTKLPHWPEFNGGIKYRGTYTDLKQEKLVINLWNNQLLSNSLIGMKSMPLKNCLDLNFIKTEMVIHKPKQRNQDNIRTKAQTCTIQGTVRIGLKPKFQQHGDIDYVAKHENYLAVHLQRLAVFDSIDDAGGDITVFATVDWSGIQKKTRGVRRPNINETMLFHIPVEEDVKRDPVKFAEFLNDELETKSEITINVWADTGKPTLENLGSGKVCLKQIHYQKFEDKVFTDERTRQKVSIQCRLHTCTVKLQSAFFDTSNSSVTLSVWFQPELPYPSVDLSRLRPKDEDSYPTPEIDLNLRNGVFQSRFNQVLARNFPPEYPTEERRFDHLFFSDQYKLKHLLPFYISKITPPDSNFLTKKQAQSTSFTDTEDTTLPAGKTQVATNLDRGIRTLSEVAHFIRCIPFRGQQEYQKERVWCSPDFMLTMKMGSVEEHALLMASMFRAVKYETQEEALEAASKQDLGSLRQRRRQKRELQQEEDKNSMNDRVFVCLGKAKETGQDHAWVMTLSKTYDEVTFWEPSLAKQYSLPGRINEQDAVKLQAYLSPNLSEEEKKLIHERRELKRQESSGWLQKMSETHQSEMDFENEENKSHQRFTHQAANHQGDQQSSDQDSSDYSEQESNFMENVQNLVYLEDLDQKYKGINNINEVGKIKGLSKEKQEHLKNLDYFSDEDEGGYINPSQKMIYGQKGEGKKKANKFLEQQEKERIEREQQRLDKHLLPVETFYDHKTGQNIKAASIQLPYSQVDLIFNHKNIWSNLQNQNPAAIFYHLHDEKQWLPLITDPAIPHQHLIAGLEESIAQQLVNELQPAGTTKKPHKKGNKKENHGILDCRMKGDYMRQFQPFYDIKGMEMPFNGQIIERLKANIVKEVEIAIKQVRSSKNLNTKIKKSQGVNNILEVQLDFLEDIECDRLPVDDHQRQLLKSHVQQELLKLVPENYRIALLPSFFNYTDAEKIRTVIVDQAQDFILGQQTKSQYHSKNAKDHTVTSTSSKKVMFAIGVKIYPFHNSICSVRLIMARMTPMEIKEAQKANSLPGSHMVTQSQGNTVDVAANATNKVYKTIVK